MRAAAKERADVLSMLRSTPDTLQALTADLDDAQARRRAAPPDEWSIAEIAAHLVDAEESWLRRRIRLMREQENPSLPYYPDHDYGKPGLEESVGEFIRLRTENLAYLEALKPSDWARRGTHVHWGPITIAWAVRHIATHDAEHLAQIGRRRRSRG